MESSRQEYWPIPSPGDLSDPEVEPGSPALQADSLPPEPPGKPLQGAVETDHQPRLDAWDKLSDLVHWENLEGAGGEGGGRGDRDGEHM